MSSTQNHLLKETSPYLQQHAHNPVHWYPWGQEALTEARRENKPILLSVGYAACHWCHVMAHESFEDQETADMMNQWFINIKVDREERPDIDKIYQTTHYMLTQRSGGWPLTVFLTPEDLVPFFSGTYFPLTARPQLPAFKDILRKIAEIFQTRHSDITTQSQRIQEILQKTQAAAMPDVVLEAQPSVLKAISNLQRTFDAMHGGFGGAPKFPNSIVMELLLQEKSQMALTTLLHMAEGGIYDQLRGGFFRYAVDAAWQIPHFEKMLYDNAQLLFIYAQAAQIYDEPYFAEIARQTADWIIAEMQSPEGGYYSTLDADSEGHEGKFYVWDKAEIQSLLTGEEFQMAKIYFGLDEDANFEDHWHLHIVEALNTPQEKAMLTSAKHKLLDARAKRIRPHRDEKIITSWNALTIKAMLVAGNILQDSHMTESGKKALHFIREKMWVNHRLLASCKDGKAHLPAYLDDYAFLLDALTTAYKILQNPDDLKFAIEIADTMLKHFADEDNGGFFFTANDHEKLLYRPKAMMDEATPAGNGIAVRALIALSQISGDSKYTHFATKTLRLAWPLISQYPTEHGALLLGLRELVP